mmetsp:Transcript_7955/g.27004  ORF Transcript_7955/g.27004 Transcript_7955/m.27004 type:complete len:229 (-) Transcript_7955:274-960(-)
MRGALHPLDCRDAAWVVRPGRGSAPCGSLLVGARRRLPPPPAPGEHGPRRRPCPRSWRGSAPARRVVPRWHRRYDTAARGAAPARPPDWAIPARSPCSGAAQQQLPPRPLTLSVFWPATWIGLLPSFICGCDAIRVLICPAIFMKASSTLVAFLALVSRKGMFTVPANSLAVSVSTWRLAVRSLLLPTRSLLTFSEAYLSISCSHVLTCSKVSASVTSYTTMMPWAPR